MIETLKPDAAKAAHGWRLKVLYERKRVNRVSARGRCGENEHFLAVLI